MCGTTVGFVMTDHHWNCAVLFFFYTLVFIFIPTFFHLFHLLHFCFLSLQFIGLFLCISIIKKRKKRKLNTGAISTLVTRRHISCDSNARYSERPSKKILVHVNKPLIPKTYISNMMDNFHFSILSYKHLFL